MKRVGLAKLSSVVVLLVGGIFWGQVSFSEESEVLEPSTVAAESASSDQVGQVSQLPKIESGSGSSLEELQASLSKVQVELTSMKKELEKSKKSSTDKKKFTCKPIGRIMMGADLIDQSSENMNLYGDVPNEFMVQDLRIGVKGEFSERLQYMLELGLQNGISYKDMFVMMKDVPLLGDTRIGHMKVESGMGYVESGFDTTFTNRYSNSNTFKADRHLGVGSTHYWADKQVRFFAGAFAGRSLTSGSDTNTNKAFISNDETGLILNTRLTGLPIYRECSDGSLDEVLHLGASYYWSSETSSNTRIRTRPTGWSFMNTYLLSGALSEIEHSITQFEIAWQKRQFGVQAEYFIGNYEELNDGRGFYILGRYMLNPGAYRKYNKEKGCFSSTYVPENLRMVDCENCRYFEGWGVWELAGMWSWTDLDNLSSLGPSGFYGKMNEYIGGINWYWNEQTRVMFFWNHAVPVSAHPGESTLETTTDTIAMQLRVRF